MVDWGREMAEEYRAEAYAETYKAVTARFVKNVMENGLDFHKAVTILKIDPDLVKTVEETLKKDEQDTDKEEN